MRWFRRSINTNCTLPLRMDPWIGKVNNRLYRIGKLILHFSHEPSTSSRIRSRHRPAAVRFKLLLAKTNASTHVTTPTMRLKWENWECTQRCITTDLYEEEQPLLEILPTRGQNARTNIGGGARVVPSCPTRPKSRRPVVSIKFGSWFP